LPLVFINTNGREIPDELKILVDIGITWNGEGEDNYTSGEFNHYYGKVGIEIRGSSSQMFPKKSYGFETRNQVGEDIDFPILGLPEEGDWILYAPYSDKSLIRNVLTFSLAKPLGHYASMCRFVELFLNNEYQGIYVLMEKIKREDTRVDIATLNPDEPEGEDLTGGYIVKLEVASDVSITLTLKLFNANGSLVESIPFSVVIGEQEFSINTEQFAGWLIHLFAPEA